MKITKHIVEFLLTINGREEQGSFDGHAFTLKGVRADQVERLGAAIEREFGVADGGAPLSASATAVRQAARWRIVEGPLTAEDERLLSVALPGNVVTLSDGRRIEIRADGGAVERPETFLDGGPAGFLARQRSREAHEDRLRREEEERAAVAQREAEEAVAAEQARKKVEAERAAEAEARAHREAERRRQDQEAAAREVEEAKARTAKLLAEQAERDRAEARAKEKAELDANLARAAAIDAERKQREEAEKAAKPAQPAVQPRADDASRSREASAASETKGAAVAPSGKHVPPPPAELKSPTTKLVAIVSAAANLGFRTLDDLFYVCFVAWAPDVPMLRAVSGTDEEKRGRIQNLCHVRRIELDGAPPRDDDADGE